MCRDGVGRFSSPSTAATSQSQPALQIQILYIEDTNTKIQIHKCSECLTQSILHILLFVCCEHIPLHAVHILRCTHLSIKLPCASALCIGGVALV